MSPTHYGRLAQRDLNPTSVFSLTFSLIAFMVLVACFAWACVWPQIRKKHMNNRNPSRTRFRDQVSATQTQVNHHLVPMFPSHPAVRRNNQKMISTTHVRTYNPHRETPFPNQPGSGLAINFPASKPRARSALQPVSALTSHGLFTPAKNKVTSGGVWSTDKSLTVPRTKAELEKVKNTIPDKDFGDAKEYILAIPEPLALKPREAGQPPARVKELKKLSTRSSTSSADKHLHPNKLFHVLNNRGEYVSQCSSTSLKIDDGKSVNTCQANNDPNTDHLSILSNGDMEGHGKDQTNPESITTVSSVPSDVENTDNEAGIHNQSIAALQRLKTLRSLTGAKAINRLTRAGTLTRPKTPVADISKIFDRSISEGIPRRCSFPGSGRSGAGPPTAPDSSEKAVSVSTATSIEFSASSLSLLPTPLTIKTQPLEEHTLPSPVMEAKRIVTAPASSNMGISKTDLIGSNKISESIRQPPKSSIPRSRPPPLKLPSTFRTLKRQQSELRALSSVGSMNVSLMPGKSPARGYPRESSVYSHDTRGVSIMRSPVSTGYSSTVNYTPTSPYFAGTAGASSDNKTETTIEQHNPVSPADMVKIKIDDWKCHVDELDIKTPRSLPPERTKSNRNPAYYQPHRISHIREDTSVISTEIHTNEARTSRISIPHICIPDDGDDNQLGYEAETGIPISHVVRQMTSDSALMVAMRGHAPGGATWV